jgi:hypothetical protein
VTLADPSTASTSARSTEVIADPARDAPLCRS